MLGPNLRPAGMIVCFYFLFFIFFGNLNRKAVKKANWGCHQHCWGQGISNKRDFRVGVEPFRQTRLKRDLSILGSREKQDIWESGFREPNALNQPKRDLPYRPALKAQIRILKIKIRADLDPGASGKKISRSALFCN